MLSELHNLSIDLASEIDDNQLLVLDVVASGGYGTVYRGEQLPLRNPVRYRYPQHRSATAACGIVSRGMSCVQQCAPPAGLTRAVADCARCALSPRMSTHVSRAGTWQGLAVAVKTILFQESSYSRRVALQEAALSKSISHPNIVATYAVDARPIGVIRPRRSSAAGQGPGGGGGGALATSTSTSSGERSMADIQDWRLYIIQVRQPWPRTQCF